MQETNNTQSQAVIEPAHRCVSCNAILTGKYCHACGERVVTDKDFSLKAIVYQAFETITDLDSKFYQTLKIFILKPGQLTLYYIAGKRRKYMKPFQVFLLCNVLFFLFLDKIDVFYMPSQWFFQDTVMGMPINEIVKSAMAEKKITESELAVWYNAKALATAKLFVIVLIPALAGVSYLLNNKKIPEFGKHAIYSTHLMSFFLIVCIFTYYLAVVFPKIPELIPFLFPVSILLYIYFLVSLKNLVAQSWVWSILKSLVLFIALYGFVAIYRVSVSIMVLKYL